MTGNSEPTSLSPSAASTPAPLARVLLFTALASLTTGTVISGIYFLAREIYGFDDRANLLLAVVFYLPYIPAAYFCGTLARRIGERRQVVIATLLMVLVTVGLALVRHVGFLWGTVVVYAIASGMLWPVIESYVAAGRHGHDMRRAIGWFNMVWSSAMCPTLWIVWFFMRLGRPELTFALLAVLHLASLFFLLKWSPSPVRHDREIGHRYTGAEYPFLLTSARILLPVGYVLIYALSPLLPGIWARLDVDLALGALLSSTWQIARVGCFFLMFVRVGWHGRWGILLIGAVQVAVGFVMVVAAPTVALVLVGLVLVGVGQGMVYYAALYYGMAVEHAQVDSGGMHETVIGLGYAIGPLLALGGYAITTTQPWGVITVVGTASLAAALTAFRPYFKARNARRPET